MVRRALDSWRTFGTPGCPERSRGPHLPCHEQCLLVKPLPRVRFFIPPSSRPTWAWEHRVSGLIPETSYCISGPSPGAHDTRSAREDWARPRGKIQDTISGCAACAKLGATRACSMIAAHSRRCRCYTALCICGTHSRPRGISGCHVVGVITYNSASRYAAY
jgi:hypothetical protein